MSAEQISLLALVVTILGWFVMFYTQRRLWKLEEEAKRENEAINKLKQSRFRVIVSLEEWFKLGLNLAEETYTFKSHPLSNEKDQETMLISMEKKLNLWIADVHQYSGIDYQLFKPGFYSSSLPHNENSLIDMRKLIYKLKSRAKEEDEAVADELFELLQEYGQEVNNFIRTSRIKDDIQSPDNIRRLYRKAHSIIQNQFNEMLSI